MLINFFHRSSFLKKKTGFTLTEALIAIILLSICAMGFFASLHTGFKITNEIRENMIATSIIQEEIEELRRTSFDSLPASGAFTNSNLSLLDTTSNNASGTIERDTYESSSDLARIVIKITWYSGFNPDKENIKRVITLIARNGINSI